MHSLRAWGVSNSAANDFGVFWEYRVPNQELVPSVWSRKVPSGTRLLTVDLQEDIMMSSLTAVALNQRYASNVSRPDVMRTSAVVKRMKPWPRRELCALTRGDLRPPSRRRWLDDWVLGHNLLLSANRSDGESVWGPCQECLPRHRTAYGLCGSGPTRLLPSHETRFWSHTPDLVPILDWLFQGHWEHLRKTTSDTMIHTAWGDDMIVSNCRHIKTESCFLPINTFVIGWLV